MTLSARRVRYGEINCIELDGGDAPEVLVVCLHGYGAPGDDLVPIAGQWAQRLGEAAARVRFVFPAAITGLDAFGLPGGRAWWPLNMAKLMEAVEASDLTELRSHQPPGLTEARAALVAAMEPMMEAARCDSGHLVLGGFSQGAMLAMDVAIRGLPQPPAILFQYSGTIICESAWTAGATRLVNTVTIQSHGTMDPILPFEGAEALYELLKVAGVPITFFPFDGPHTLTLEALDATADATRTLLGDSDSRNSAATA